MIRYGKSSNCVVQYKQDYFVNNQRWLERSDRQIDLLLKQPVRKSCKICNASIDVFEKGVFKSHRVEYFECPYCGHINSKNEDTKEFSDAVYTIGNYEDVYTEIIPEKYFERVDGIYLPKVNFLYDALLRENVGIRDCEILDVGAGSGYFVSALRKRGFRAEGIEVSKSQVNFGNRVNGETILYNVAADEVCSKVENYTGNIISFIGVLEHLYNLREVIQTVKNHKNIKYVYFSVPLFSFSCVLEACFQKCFNRQTMGTHTHLFTDSSILKMISQMGCKLIDSWRFGSDLMDLNRMVMTTLRENENESMAEYFKDKMDLVMDKMQLVVDQADFSSEIHIIAKRK